MKAPVVLGLRAAILAVMAAGAVAAFVAARARESSPASGTAYACPMHPEVTSGEPGVCPICRMDLEAVGPGESRRAAVGRSTFQAYDYVRRRGVGQDLHAPAWIDADGTLTAIVYRDEMPALTQEEPALYASSATPDERVPVHPAPDPATPWDASTLRVRFRFDPSARAHSPGEVGWLVLGARRLEALVVPSTALLHSAEGTYVLVASGDGRSLGRRPVEIGRVLGGLAVVTSGLRAQERVLTRSAFFVDAERRLRKGATVELEP